MWFLVDTYISLSLSLGKCLYYVFLQCLSQLLFWVTIWNSGCCYWELSPEHALFHHCARKMHETKLMVNVWKDLQDFSGTQTYVSLKMFGLNCSQ